MHQVSSLRWANHQGVGLVDVVDQVGRLGCIRLLQLLGRRRLARLNAGCEVRFGAGELEALPTDGDNEEQRADPAEPHRQRYDPPPNVDEAMFHQANLIAWIGADLENLDASDGCATTGPSALFRVIQDILSAHIVRATATCLPEHWGRVPEAAE